MMVLKICHARDEKSDVEKKEKEVEVEKHQKEDREENSKKDPNHLFGRSKDERLNHPSFLLPWKEMK